MKSSGIAVLLLIATLYYALGQEGVATGVQCGPVQCFADQSCCNDVVYGPLCFGSQNYSCLAAEDGTNRLCPQQFGLTTAGVCGTSHTCYYIEEQACILGFIVPRTGGRGSHVEEPTTPQPQPTQPPQPQPTQPPQPQPTQPPGGEQPPEPQPTQPPQPQPTQSPGGEQPPEPQPTTPEPQPTTQPPSGGTEQPPGGPGLTQGGQSVGGQCSSISCTEGSCCQDVFYGGLCFTPNSYACLQTETGAQRLCPQPAGSSAGVCGPSNVCYFTTTHGCVNGEVTSLQPIVPLSSPAPQPTQSPQPQPTQSPGGEQPPNPEGTIPPGGEQGPSEGPTGRG